MLHLIIIILRRLLKKTENMIKLRLKYTLNTARPDWPTHFDYS